MQSGRNQVWGLAQVFTFYCHKSQVSLAFLQAPHTLSSLNTAFPPPANSSHQHPSHTAVQSTYLFWSSSFSCRSCPISDRIPRSVLVKELIWLRSSCSICLLACRSAFNFLMSCSNLRQTILKEGVQFKRLHFPVTQRSQCIRRSVQT